MSIKLFCELNREWELTSSGRAARRALDRWQVEEPALREATNLSDLVRLSHSRRPDRSDAVLGALLRLGRSDDLANRVVFHAVMPGLISHARRFIRGGCPAEDAASALVAACWERISRYPLDRRPRSIGANIVLDSQQIAAAALFRHAGREVPIPSPPETGTRGWDWDPTMQLLRVLEHAVRSGVVSPAEARLVAITRIQGVPIRDLAAHEGIKAHSLRRRRLRVEAALSAALAA